MNALIACEYSGIVRDAFIEQGHNAVSCDLLPCESPGPHLQCDVRDVMYDPKWDIVIAFPPCTDLAVSGAAYFAKKRESGSQQKSVEFFMMFTTLKVPTSIENPIGIMSSIYRVPDQIVNPFQFGDPVSKKTCLWLHDLPPLLPFDEISHGSRYITASSGRRYPEWCWNTGGGSGKKRSLFFPGIARAMAKQWGTAL